jgi:hypothetical protein
MNYILTKEEKKHVIYMVMESYQSITLSEVKNNNNIKSEIKLNLEFYSGLKEILLKNKKLKEAIHTGIGWLDNIILGIGSIKDLLTTTDIGKWLSEKIRNLANKLFPSFAKNPNDWTDKLKKAIDNITKWLGPKSIAYILAAWKAKSFKPGNDAIQVEMEKATKIYKIILIILILLAAVKLFIFIAPFFSAATAASVSAALSSAVQHAGIIGFAGAGFNILGLINKIKHLSHDEGEHEIKKSLGMAQNYLSHGSE